MEQPDYQGPLRMRAGIASLGLPLPGVGSLRLSQAEMYLQLQGRETDWMSFWIV